MPIPSRSRRQRWVNLIFASTLDFVGVWGAAQPPPHKKLGRTRWRSQVAASCGLLFTLGLVTGCQVLTNAPRPTPTRSGLKLGTLLPITGDLSQYGTSMQHSAELLVQTVNACGGVLQQPVTLIAEDDQTDPAIAVNAMTKLIEIDQVGAVVGAASSAVASAAVDLAVRNQVVLISPSSTSPVFTERAAKGEFQRFWWRTAPPDNFQGQALAQLAWQRGDRTVSILAINNDYGQGLAQTFTTAFQALGGKQVRPPVFYLPTNATFDAEVRAAWQPQPEAVLLIAYPETGSLILKAAYEQGVLTPRTQILATDGLKDSQLAELVGRTTTGQYLAAGIIGTAPSAAGPALQSFRDRYQAAHQRPPSIFAPNTWDAVAVVVLAAEAAQATTGTAIRDRLPEVANPPGEIVTDVCQGLSLLRQGRDINYQGASGAIDFDAQGDVTGSYEVWQIQPDGSLQVMDTLMIQGNSSR